MKHYTESFCANQSFVKNIINQKNFVFVLIQSNITKIKIFKINDAMEIVTRFFEFIFFDFYFVMCQYLFGKK